MALTCNTNEEKIWNYLFGKIGNAYGVSGLMGNLFAESGLKPNNLQDTGNKKLNITDDEYVKAVDNGTYSKEQFINDGQGVFLAQWTYPTRKKALYEFAKSQNKSIGDLNLQLEFLYKELSEDYKSVLKVLKTATSVFQASNAVLFDFENPKDQSELVQAKRANCGKKYYDKYVEKNTDDNKLVVSANKSKFEMRTTKPEAGNKYYITKANGGYSPAIKGSPTDSDCDVLSNCVGYALGRFNEIGSYGYCKYLKPVNAERFIETKNEELEVGQTPKLGACMVWQKGDTLKGSDGAGHVAIVEKVINDTEVYTSESSYGSKAFYNKTRKKGKGNWGMGSSYDFLGFIYNPAVKESITKPSTAITPPIATTPIIKIDSAKSFSKSLASTYTTTAKLNMRVGAGISKSIITVIPKGSKVICYGYYTSVDGVKWYYVKYKNNNNIGYTGFVSSQYLTK